jgi:hypothetical protein
MHIDSLISRWIGYRNDNVRACLVIQSRVLDSIGNHERGELNGPVIKIPRASGD